MSIAVGQRRRIAQGLLLFWLLSLASSLYAQCVPDLHDSSIAHHEPGQGADAHAGILHHGEQHLSHCCESPAMAAAACTDGSTVLHAAFPEPRVEQPDDPPLSWTPGSPVATSSLAAVLNLQPATEPAAGLKPSLFQRLRVLRI